MAEEKTVTTNDYLPHLDIRARYAELVCLQDKGIITYADSAQMKNIEDVFYLWTRHAKNVWGYQ